MSSRKSGLVCQEAPPGKRLCKKHLDDDLKVLIYSSPDGVPHPEEISEVTDYVCAYCCKGNETTAVERETLRDFILK